MTLRAALTTLLLASGLAQAQPDPGADPSLTGGRWNPAGPGPQVPPAPATATPAAPTDPTAPAAVPPPEAVAPPSDPDTLPAGVLPLAIAPAEPVEVVAGPYPRALVERPLVIPGGMLEASLTFVYARTEMPGDKTFTSMGISPDVSYSVGRFGLSAGADVILDVTPDVVMFAGQSFQFQDEQRLLAAYASARFAPTPDLSLGLQFVGQGLTTDVPRTTVRLAASYKARVAPRLAVVASVFPGFSRTTYDDVGMNISESRLALVAGGRLGATVQVAPLIALVAHSKADVRYEGAADTNAFVLVGEPGATASHDHGLSLHASLTPNLDLGAGALVFFSERPMVLQLGLGFTARTQ